jgi:hypothetical protein
VQQWQARRILSQAGGRRIVGVGLQQLLQPPGAALVAGGVAVAVAVHVPAWRALGVVVRQQAGANVSQLARTPAHAQVRVPQQQLLQPLRREAVLPRAWHRDARRVEAKQIDGRLAADEVIGRCAGGSRAEDEEEEEGEEGGEQGRGHGAGAPMAARTRRAPSATEVCISALQNRLRNEGLVFRCAAMRARGSRAGVPSEHQQQ